MAVYERTFRRYEGALTAQRGRFLVITRYALEGVFASRLFTAFYAGCFLPTLVGLFLVYLSHNTGVLAKVGASSELMSGLTMAFFEYLFIWQAVPAFFLSVLIGPGLVAPDLSNSALPLYLARPVGRVDYVLGKLAVLVALLSPPTWVGGLLLWTLQAVLERGSWWSDNLRIAVAYVVGHGVWIVVVSLLSLAVSAWVRVRPLAVGALVGLYVFQMVGAASVNASTGTRVGTALSLVQCVYVVVKWIFHPSSPTAIPLAVACVSLAAVAAASVGLLVWKLKAHEVVR